MLGSWTKVGEKVVVARRTSYFNSLNVLIVVFLGCITYLDKYSYIFRENICYKLGVQQDVLSATSQESRRESTRNEPEMNF